jgi:hypothetical protein
VLSHVDSPISSRQSAYRRLHNGSNDGEGDYGAGTGRWPASGLAIAALHAY